MTKILAIILLMSVTSPILAATTQRDRLVRVGDCIGDRCIIRDRGGRRLGTITRENTGRLRVNDRTGRTVAKVTDEGDGRYRIIRPR